MKLYLVRHGAALPQEIDPERGLTEPGKEAIGKLAGYLAARGVRIGRVAHSGKARARQTAEILAAAVAPKVSVEKMAGLNPSDPPEPVAAQANEWPDDTMLVGHLPFMGLLTSLLAAKNVDAAVAEFATGGLVCLGRYNDRDWIILWSVHPGIVG